MQLTPQQQQFKKDRNMQIFLMSQKGDKSSTDIGKEFNLTGQAVRGIVNKMEKYQVEAEIYKERMKEEKVGI